MTVLIRNLVELDIENTDSDKCLSVIRSTPIENLAIRFNKFRRYDYGSLCYTDRFSASRKKVRPVTSESMLLHRQPALRRWVTFNISEFFISRSTYTCYQENAYLSSFLNWCDLSGFENVLRSPEEYKLALQNYSLHLHQRTKDDSLVSFTANRSQATPLKAAEVIFPDAKINFHKDLLILSNIDPKENQTPPPNDRELGDYLSKCEYIFEGLTNFLLNHSPFPARLDLGEERPWLMLGEYPFATKKIIATTPKIQNNIFWDYKTAKLRTLENCKKLSSQLPHQIERQHREHQQLLIDANRNLHHPKRLRLAKLAHDAFLPLFTVNTGMNDGPIGNIPWDGNYTTDTSTKQGFKTIKYRAKNRAVSFEIQSCFVKSFKKFVKLREFICDGHPQPLLFLGMDVHHPEHISQLRPNEIFNFNQRLTNYMDPDFKGFSFRQLRSFKSNFHLEAGESISTTAQLLQNTEAAVRKSNSYCSVDEEKAIGEITAVLSRLETMLENYSDESIPAGGCGSPGSPGAEFIVPAGYEPDCKNMAGCIFCHNYRLHPRPEDIRKLVSMRFVISNRIHRCDSLEQFTQIHQPAIFYIDYLLDFLGGVRPELVPVINDIVREVNEEYNLTPFWERQYTRQLTLGLSR